MENNKFTDLYLKLHHRVDILVISKTLKVTFLIYTVIYNWHFRSFKNVISWVSCSGSFSVELAQGTFIVIRDVSLKKLADTLPFIVLFPTPKQLKN